MSAAYISHARSASELQLEVLGDLRRRIALLDAQRNAIRFSEAEKARVARAINELEQMLHYWTELQVIGKKGKVL